jgi:hypothetical protein
LVKLEQVSSKVENSYFVCRLTAVGETSLLIFDIVSKEWNITLITTKMAYFVGYSTTVK